MTIDHYPSGQTITLTSPSFKDDAGALLPIREIAFSLRSPLGTVEAFDARQLERTGTRYRYRFTPSVAGTWGYRWRAETRIGSQVEEGRFIVGRDRFTSDQIVADHASQEPI